MNASELQKYKNNIWKNYIASFLGGICFFYNGIETLYYRHFELSFQQIGWLFGLSSLALIIFEIPSGAFSDLYGKKKALVFAAIIYAIGSTIITYMGSFWAFSVGFTLWGIAGAFNSGSGSALLYESLEKIGVEKKFVKHTGRIDAIFISLDIVSGFIGPLLFALFIRIPFIIGNIASFLSILVFLSLYEPSNNSQIIKKGLWQRNIKQMKESMITAFSSSKFVKITIFTVIFFTIGRTFSDLILLPFLNIDLGFPLTVIAFMALISNPFQVSIVFSSNKLEEKLGDFKSLLLVVIISCLSIMGMILNKNIIFIGFIIGIYFGVGSYSYVIREKYIIHHSPENQRATLLSANSMFNSLFILLILPTLGAIIDITSSTAVLWILFCIYLFLGFFIFTFKE